MILGALKVIAAVVAAAALAGVGYVLVEEVIDPGEDFGFETAQFEGDGMVVRALGDSVTAGFGYGDADGAQFEVGDLGLCGSKPAHPRCQDPDGVAYPARFARRVPEVNFKNYAVAGSTAADWLGEGRTPELSEQLQAKLGEVVAADPDVTVLTLGANPLLKSFLFGSNRFCATTPIRSAARECVREALREERVRRRLERIYAALLATPPEGRNGLVVVFQYPETHPASGFGLNVAVLIEELRATIASAAAAVRDADPERGERLLVAEPGPFLNHGCDDEQPWILRVDTCIHPNAAGHAQLAAVLEQVVREHRTATSTAAVEPQQFAEPGTSCGVRTATAGRGGEPLELVLGVTHGRMSCDEIEGLLGRYLSLEPSCTIANGVSGCLLEFDRWSCYRAPGVWMHPANFTCDSKADPDEVPDVVGLYPQETAPLASTVSCGSSGEGGGPFHVRANFECEAAMHVAESFDHKFGFRCVSETTGIESSHTVCRLDGARIEWANGA